MEETKDRLENLCPYLTPPSLFFLCHEIDSLMDIQFHKGLGGSANHGANQQDDLGLKVDKNKDAACVTKGDSDSIVYNTYLDTYRCSKLGFDQGIGTKGQTT